MLRPTLDAGDLAREKRRGRPGDRRGGRHAGRPGVRAGPGRGLRRPAAGPAGAGRPRPASAPPTPTALEAWRARLYAPDRLVVSAAGAVDEDELLALAERLFGDAPRRGAADAPRRRAFTGGRAARGRAAGAGAPGAAAAGRRRASIRTISPCACSPRRWAAACRSRLFQEARERLGLAYAIDAFAEALCRTPACSASTPAARRKRRGRGWPRWRRARSASWPSGVGAAELARAKAQLKAAPVHGARVAAGPRRAGRRASSWCSTGC